MPDFTRCVKYKDSVYCWDNELKKFVKVVITPVEIKECPA